MNKAINFYHKISEWILTVYFLMASVFFIFSTLIAFSLFFRGEIFLSLYKPVETGIWAVLYLVGFYLFKSRHKLRFTWAIAALLLTLAVITIHRYFFVTGMQLGKIDLQNTLIFGIPAVIAIIAKLSGFPSKNS